MIRRLLLCLGLGLVLTAGQAAAMSRAEFESRAQSLMSSPANAQKLLDLCAAATPFATDPGYRARIHGYTSHALWLTGHYARAENEARQALALDQDDTSAYFFLADALNARGRYDEAYRSCLLGAQRRGGAQVSAARTRCREDYLEHVSRSPTALLAAARIGRLPVGREVLIRGPIADISGDTIIFNAGQGRVVCPLVPQGRGSALHPMTEYEAGKTSKPVFGLKKNQTVTLQGVVAATDNETVRLEGCTLIP